jgi:hypothetical protein
MCADTADLTYETMLIDPLIRLVMQSDGVTEAEFATLLHEVAEARAEPQPRRSHLTLVHCSALPWLAVPQLQACAAGS